MLKLFSANMQNCAIQFCFVFSISLQLHFTHIHITFFSTNNLNFKFLVKGGLEFLLIVTSILTVDKCMMVVMEDVYRQ